MRQPPPEYDITIVDSDRVVRVGVAQIAEHKLAAQDIDREGVKWQMIAILIVDFGETLGEDPAEKTRVVESQINKPNAGCNNDDKEKADISHLVFQ